MSTFTSLPLPQENEKNGKLQKKVLQHININEERFATNVGLYATEIVFHVCLFIGKN